MKTTIHSSCFESGKQIVIRHENCLIHVEPKKHKIEISTWNSYTEIKRTAPRRFLVRKVLFEDWTHNCSINGVNHEFNRHTLVNESEFNSGCSGIKNIMKGLVK